MVPVLTVVAIIGAPDEKFDGCRPQAAAEAEAEAKAEAEAEAAGDLGLSRDRRASKVFASPRARKLAAEKDVDLARR